MLRRVANFSTVALLGLAVVDVFSGWKTNNLPLILFVIAAGVGVTAVQNLWLRRAIAILATGCFVIHAAAVIQIRNITHNWESIKDARAEEILSDSEVFIREVIDGLSTVVVRSADDPGVVEGLRSLSAKSLFDALGELIRGSSKQVKIEGIVAADTSGKVLAWQGHVPDSVGIYVTRKREHKVALVTSTTHDWLEVRQPVTVDGDLLGLVIAYRKIKPRFAYFTRHRASEDIQNELRRLTGYNIRFDLALRDQQHGIAEGVKREVRLPDGTLLGFLGVQMPLVSGEVERINQEGLFLASVLSLALIAVAFALSVRLLLGRRFVLASNPNILSAVLALIGLRAGIALVREHLLLERYEAFTSVDFATQAPLGILRSPFDLAVTGVVALVAAVIVLIARVRRPASRFRTGSRAQDAIPAVILAAIAGIGAAGLMIGAAFLLKRIHNDMSFDLLSVSAFDFHASVIFLRIGLISITLAAILGGAAILESQLVLLRRISRTAEGWKGLFTLGIVFAGLVIGFVVAGAEPVAIGIAALSLAFSILLDRIRTRKYAFSLIAVTLLLVLAASVVEFPFALSDHLAKKEAAIEALASRIARQTDEWKLLVLEQTADDIESNAGIIKAIRNPGRGLDAFALRLWANSIMSPAGLNGGIYILDSHDRIVGRFAPGQVGDISNIEGMIRRARLSMQKMLVVTAATIGSRTVPVHLGVIPIFDADVYLGCIVVAIPHGYSDLESLVRSGGGLFDLVGGRAGPDEMLGYDVDASIVSSGRITSTTSSQLEVGKTIKALEGRTLAEPMWFQLRVGGKSNRCYAIRPEGRTEAILFNFPLPATNERIVYFMSILVGYIILGFVLLSAAALSHAIHYAIRRMRGASRLRLRWSFGHKLALAFVLIAIVPTLILGTARGHGVKG